MGRLPMHECCYCPHSVWKLLLLAIGLASYRVVRMSQYLTLLSLFNAARMISDLRPMEAAANSAFLSSLYSWMWSGLDFGSQIAIKKSRAWAYKGENASSRMIPFGHTQKGRDAWSSFKLDLVKSNPSMDAPWNELLLRPRADTCLLPREADRFPADLDDFPYLARWDACFKLDNRPSWSSGVSIISIWCAGKWLALIPSCSNPKIWNFAWHLNVHATSIPHNLRPTRTARRPWKLNGLLREGCDFHSRRPN